METRSRGFALVLTLVLLGLLVLAIYALAAINRVGAEVATTAVFATQARQNAQLALSMAMEQLQRLAGDDRTITTMAGMAGVAPGPAQPTRHWCGVWSDAGLRLGWLVSGEVTDPAPSAPMVELVSAGSVGADAADKERVSAPRLPLRLSRPEGGTWQAGNVAWWIGDEGVKLSAVIPVAESPVAGGVHAIDELIPSLSPTSPALAQVVAYGQIASAPSPALTPGVLQANFHSLGVTHIRMLDSGTAQAGLFNINTTTVRFWRGVAATYNMWKSADAPVVVPADFALRMRDLVALADGTAGKPAGAPFQTVDQFLQSVALSTALGGSGARVEEFAPVMRAWLCTRSDTFRIRAYGEALNPADDTRREAEAYCEAIVQRTSAPLGGFGRRYAVISFRWLGPDDL